MKCVKSSVWIFRADNFANCLQQRQQIGRHKCTHTGSISFLSLNQTHYNTYHLYAWVQAHTYVKFSKCKFPIKAWPTTLRVTSSIRRVLEGFRKLPQQSWSFGKIFPHGSSFLTFETPNISWAQVCWISHSPVCLYICGCWQRASVPSTESLSLCILMALWGSSPGRRPTTSTKSGGERRYEWRIPCPDWLRDDRFPRWHRPGPLARGRHAGGSGPFGYSGSIISEVKKVHFYPERCAQIVLVFPDGVVKAESKSVQLNSEDLSNHKKHSTPLLGKSAIITLGRRHINLSLGVKIRLTNGDHVENLKKSSSRVMFCPSSPITPSGRLIQLTAKVFVENADPAEALVYTVIHI